MVIRVFFALLLLFTAPASSIVTAAVSATGMATADDRKSEIVAFNTKSLKIHCVTCSAAKRCTRNCINITRAEAKARGGVACKICGGSCISAD